MIGRADDAARYAELADGVRAAWQAEYIDADGACTRTPRPTTCGRSPSTWCPHELRDRRGRRGWSS